MFLLYLFVRVVIRVRVMGGDGQTGNQELKVILGLFFIYVFLSFYLTIWSSLIPDRGKKEPDHHFPPPLCPLPPSRCPLMSLSHTEIRATFCVMYVCVYIIYVMCDVQFKSGNRVLDPGTRPITYGLLKFNSRLKTYQCY